MTLSKSPKQRKTLWKKRDAIPLAVIDFFVGQRITPLVHKSMVYHNQERIEARGEGKISDKITGNLLEWAGCQGFDGRQWRYDGVSVGFVLLASCTAFDISADIGGETWPPELSCEELMGFEEARVAGGFVIVTPCEDRAAEGVIIRDVDMAFVCR